MNHFGRVPTGKGVLCLAAWMSVVVVGHCDVAFPTIELTVEKSNVHRPVFATHAGDGSGRLFVIEHPGIIQILKDSDYLAEAFLDISAAVTGGDSGGDERGLLGLAFPPDFSTSTNQYFYIYYYISDKTRISRFYVSDEDPNVADIDSEEVILEIDQTQSNHNGGQIEFGPDGYLYVASGDGGGGNDDDGGHTPGVGNGQDGQKMLGKILRIDVETLPLRAGYDIPPDNPFVGDSTTLDEIWAVGLRNPYRMSFDTLTGNLFIGDVGQSAWEEIDAQPANSKGGENYGWRLYEGNFCKGIEGAPCPGSTDGLTFPVYEYPHDNGDCSVTGGFVHRGAEEWKPLSGTYIYGDWCSGRIWGLKRETGATIDTTPINSGIAVVDDATGKGYIMYSAASVHTRFPANRPHNANSDHLIAVQYDGQWKFHNNVGLNPFSPRATDILLAEVDYDNDTTTSLRGAWGSENGIQRGFAFGDLTFLADQWNGNPNDGEFLVLGTHFVANGAGWTNQLLLDASFRIAGFGQNEQGDLFVCDLDRSTPGNGNLHKILDTTELVDSDNDTMPDAFEVFYGLATNDVADALLDTDRDGMANGDEFIAGTDPTNPDSDLSFMATDFAPTTKEIVLHWPSVADRTYSVSRTTNFLEGFSVLATNLVATPTLNVYTSSVPDDSDGGAFRIEVESSE